MWTGNGKCDGADLKIEELRRQPCNALFIVEQELGQQLTTNYNTASKDANTAGFFTSQFDNPSVLVAAPPVTLAKLEFIT